MPATLADVNKAKKRATDDGIKAAITIFLSVMHDKKGWGKKRMQGLWDDVNDMSDSVARGYVSLEDLQKMLKDECGIILTD